MIATPLNAKHRDAGVAYPAVQIRRTALEQAGDTLSAILAEGPR